MLIASKYEETYAPMVEDFVFVTDRAYSQIQIRAMEGEILKTLDFELGKPFCLQFLRRNSKAGSVSVSSSNVLSLFQNCISCTVSHINLYTAYRSRLPIIQNLCIHVCYM